MLLEKRPPLRTRPPFRFLVLVHEPGRPRTLTSVNRSVNRRGSEVLAEPRAGENGFGPLVLLQILILFLLPLRLSVQLRLLIGVVLRLSLGIQTVCGIFVEDLARDVGPEFLED